jgi:hypothetical protein
LRSEHFGEDGDVDFAFDDGAEMADMERSFAAPFRIHHRRISNFFEAQEVTAGATFYRSDRINAVQLGARLFGEGITPSVIFYTNHFLPNPKRHATDLRRNTGMPSSNEVVTAAASGPGAGFGAAAVTPSGEDKATDGIESCGPVADPRRLIVADRVSRPATRSWRFTLSEVALFSTPPQASAEAEREILHRSSIANVQCSQSSEVPPKLKCAGAGQWVHFMAAPEVQEVAANA